jgi:hypothetical protein
VQVRTDAASATKDFAAHLHSRGLDQDAASTPMAAISASMPSGGTTRV